MDAIKWNFTKFVVDKEGQPKARFAPTDDPAALEFDRVSRKQRGQYLF